MPAPIPVAQIFTQPILPATNSGWKINCVDMQIITKQDAWNPGQTERIRQLQAIKNLGANYVAFGYPYENTTKWANFIADARMVGLKIFHRSHWNTWEGDNGAEATLGCQQYLDDAYDFIVAHPSYFEDGDIFAMCVEPNNANDNGNYTFRVPETSEGAFNIGKYNQFMIDQVSYANAAFLAIGKSVMTCPIAPSMSLVNLAGQTLDSGNTGRAGGFTAADVETYFDGIMAIDHYLDDDYRFEDATKYWDKYSSDLDKIYAALAPRQGIIVSEWGYHTTTNTGKGEQHGMYEKIVDVLRSKPYIMGVNFWNHMGQAQSSIFDDASGSITPGSRNTKNAIARAFTTGNAAYGSRARAS